jgi:hypothetical protein
MLTKLGKRKNNNVHFEIHPETGEPLARTRSGQLYSQGPILPIRKRAKEENKDAMVLNDDELSARPPLINGVRRSDWTTNDEDLYQTDEDRKKARNDVYSEMTPQELDNLYKKKWISKEYRSKILSDANSQNTCKSVIGCPLMGGKTRNKKTNRRKRKTNRRKRYSRRRTLR